jgi:hypothetical protein
VQAEKNEKQRHSIFSRTEVQRVVQVSNSANAKVNAATVKRLFDPHASSKSGFHVIKEAPREGG